MIKSIRSISSGLVAVSIIALTFSFSSVMISRCISGSDCAAAVSLYRNTRVKETIPFYSGSTPTTMASGDTSGISFQTIAEIVQITASYGLILGVLILLILETQELYYLKRLAPHRRRA